MDASDLNSKRDDEEEGEGEGEGEEEEEEEDDDDSNYNSNANGWVSPKDVRDCDAHGGPTLAENVGVLTLLPRSSTLNCYIQHSSALLSGNISKPLSSVLEFTSPRTLFHLT